MAKPKMTAMNLQVLSELLDGEGLAHKKFCAYVAQCQDPVLREKLGTMANNCKNRYDSLLNYLNSHE